MRNYLKAACESVDAAVFTGDFLYQPDERAEFREYLERWLRESAKHDEPIEVDASPMKTHFRNRQIPPVTAQELVSVGVNPEDLWFSPTFNCWVFSGATCANYPHLMTTGAIIRALGLAPHVGA